MLLGVGAWWDPLAAKVGVSRARPLRMMREVVESVRALLRCDGPVGYHGEFVHDAVDKYLEISPWTYAKQIETPLLILHSENDLRCNIEQAEALFTTLRLLGKEVEFVRFPAESHELTRSGNPVHRVQRFELVLDWFDRYLK